MNNKLFILIIVGIVSLFVAMALFSDEEPTQTSETQPQLRLSDIHGLEVDIDNPDRLYLPNHQGLYVQESDGVLRKAGSISDDFMSFALSPSESGVFYASGHPKTGGNFGLTKTTDGGDSWTKVSDGLDGPVDFHTMAIDNNNDQLIYGYYRGALQRSDDGGTSWQYLANAPDQIIQLSAGKNEGQLYAATVGGLQISQDKGESWTAIESIEETVTAIEVNASNGQMFVYGVNSGLIVSDNKGETWTEVGYDSIDDQVLFIASSRTNPNQVYLVTKSLEIYKSNDSGETWSVR
jgi:photosystem II stability/assembly factor-like uncharacterized protein